MVRAIDAGSLIAHVADLRRAGATAPCISSVAGGLAGRVVEGGRSSSSSNNSSSPQAALDALGAAARQQQRGAEGGAAVAAALFSNAQFMALAGSAVGPVALVGGDVVARTAVRALIRLSEDRTRVHVAGFSDDRVAGAAAHLAVTLLADSAHDAAAQARSCYATLVEVCSMEDTSSSVDKDKAVPVVAEALLGHTAFVAAALAAPGAGRGLARALRGACSCSPPRLIRAVLGSDAVMAAVTASAEGVRNLALALCAASMRDLAAEAKLLLARVPPPAGSLAAAGPEVAVEVAAALRVACEGGHADVVAVLAAHQQVAAAVLAAPGHGETVVAALRAASSKGHTRAVQALLSCAPLMGAVLAVPEAELSGRAHDFGQMVRDGSRHAYAGGAAAALVAHAGFTRVLVSAAAAGEAGPAGCLAGALYDACRDGREATVAALLANPTFQQVVLGGAAAAQGQGRELITLLCDACKGASAEVVEALLADAATTQSLGAQGDSGACALTKALADACKRGRVGVVRALLSSDAARRAVLAPKTPGRAGELVWALWDACENSQAGVLQLLLADAQFVEVMLGAGSSGSERLAKALKQAQRRGNEAVVEALQGSSAVVAAAAPYLPKQPSAPPQPGHIEPGAEQADRPEAAAEEAADPGLWTDDESEAAAEYRAAVNSCPSGMSSSSSLPPSSSSPCGSAVSLGQMCPSACASSACRCHTSSHATDTPV
ncbi:hypothetical protein HXX76_012427 [Chlamydomonas incerta]|uniref:Uncharacterized protein n=1 Tax=Chlamydomonas incerta TaxID=51695 RepID=A0A835SI95_CHLIN|nr:hypothetical protein HXX76_012427 [Chlamydomonas incerta]|eukprot:KAG2427494.1 hypothetical protein HXX76_012427 [Chlamydomonas incerta]